MRTFTTRISAILALLLIVAWKPAYAQEIKVPDVHDGTWLLLRTANYRITLPTSPTTETTFTIGTARTYQQIGTSVQVTEIMPLQEPSQPVLTIWNEEKTLYYALLVDKELKIGNQLNVTIDNHPCAGSWTQAFINVAPAGPVLKWWTLRLVNPEIVPQAPAPLSSPKRRST